MKTILIAAAALFALGALPAVAAEGNGEPFAFQDQGITTMTAGNYAPDTGSAAYPVVAGRPGSMLGVYAGTMAPDTGSEQTVQTANSLPLGAQDSARAYATLGGSMRVQTMMAQVGPRG